METKRYGGVEFNYLGSVINNYRRDYKAKFNEDCPLTDVQIAEVYDQCEVAPTSQEQDEWMVEDMRQRVKELGL